MAKKPLRCTYALTKYNAAALLGWRVLRFTTDMVSSGIAIDTVKEAIKQ